MSVMSIAIAAMLFLVALKLIWNVVAISIAVAKEADMKAEGSSRAQHYGLSLMVVEPFFLAIAVIIGFWVYEEPVFAVVTAVAGSIAIVGSYALGFGIGALAGKMRRRCRPR